MHQTALCQLLLLLLPLPPRVDARLAATAAATAADPISSVSGVRLGQFVALALAAMLSLGRRRRHGPLGSSRWRYV